MAAKDDRIGSLEEESRKRKERLKNLKRKANKTDGEGETDDDNQAAKPVFRSYKPQDERIKENALEQVPTGTIEEEVKDQLELLKTPIVIEDIDIVNLAPRKPDWDLKRDVAKKLEKLERRTQKAIAEIIRDRLKMNQENIHEVVNVGTAIGNKETETED